MQRIRQTRKTEETRVAVRRTQRIRIWSVKRMRMTMLRKGNRRREAKVVEGKGKVARMIWKLMAGRILLKVRMTREEVVMMRKAGIKILTEISHLSLTSNNTKFTIYSYRAGIKHY
jgi:hypothetical protein